MSASSDVVNEALQKVGYDGPAVSGAGPNSFVVTGSAATAPGAIANLVYGPSVSAVARMHQWDSIRTTGALTLSGNVAPFPWTLEYLYPTGTALLWQLLPPQSAVPDLNNPAPIDWVRGATLVNNVSAPVIWTNLVGALAVYGAPPVETTWDALFREDVVEYLASVFAMSALGKPDLSQSYFERVGTMTQVGSARSDT